MGVMPCERKGCDNVMCDNTVKYDYSDHYICDDCLTQLREACKHWPATTRAWEVPVLVAEFMVTSWEAVENDPAYAERSDALENLIWSRREESDDDEERS